METTIAFAHAAPVAITTRTFAITGDLCGYVGATVNPGTWQSLQAECVRRYGGTWHFDAEQSGDGWHITHLHARPGDDGADPEAA